MNKIAHWLNASRLNSSNVEVRLRAAEKLLVARTTHQLDVPLIILRDTKADVNRNELRCRAIRALTVFDDFAAVDALIAVVTDSNESKRAREVAAEALRSLQNPRAVKPLLSLVGKTEGWLREVVIGTLDVTDASWLETPEGRPIKAVRQQVESQTAADNRINAIKQNADALMERYGSGHTDEEKSDAQKAFLDFIHQHGFEPLFQAYVRDPRVGSDPMVAAIRCVGDESVEVLCGLLANDPRGPCRKAAAGILSVVGGARAVDSLLTAMKDSVAGVRAAAARGLGSMGGRKACESLASHLGDRNSEVVHEIVFALGRCSDQRSVDGLVEILQSTAIGHSIRSEATSLLLPFARANELLQIQLSRLVCHHTSFEVREAAFSLIMDAGASAHLIERLNAGDYEDILRMDGYYAGDRDDTWVPHEVSFRSQLVHRLGLQAMGTHSFGPERGSDPI